MNGAYRNVNDSDARSEVRIRLRLVDECMLAPVSDHHSQSHDGQWQKKHEEGGSSIEIGKHGIQESVARKFAATRFESKIRLARAEEVPWQIEPDEDVESTEVVQEMPDIVALVPDRGRQVVRSVTFDVVMLDVVEIVRVPCVAHQRVHNVWECQIDQRVCLVQYAAHMYMLVHHQCVRAHVVELHDRMQWTVPPVEVVE